ncbi:MAG TPA: cytochrome P450 [Pseudonocardiaceae bacterium]|nr:cytochrome P450 [Pseudonocardiaceae bacterium]
MPRQCPYDPPARLGQLRAEAPITRVRSWDGSTPWLITNHEYARAALSDPGLGSSPARPGFPPVGPGDVSGQDEQRPGVLLTMDGAEHARLRRKLIGEFTVRRIEALRPRVEQAVRELLDAMADGPKPVDLVAALALPLPSLIISELLGVPDTDHAFFQRHSRAALDTETSPELTQHALGELVGYLRDLVAAKQAHPGDDLLSRLLATSDLTPREISGVGTLLLVAGHETTANQIALGVLTLLRHPGQADELRATDDPAAIRTAVEELLRLASLTQAGARRVAVADVRIGEVLISAGEGVIIATNAANRDPAAFDHPDDYDPHRAVNRHVAFGFGPHQCLGQPMARLELQVVHPALLRRFPTMTLAVDPADLSYRDTMPMYGVNELPVTW